MQWYKFYKIPYHWENDRHNYPSNLLTTNSTYLPRLRWSTVRPPSNFSSNTATTKRPRSLHSVVCRNQFLLWSSFSLLQRNYFIISSNKWVLSYWTSVTVHVIHINLAILGGVVAPIGYNTKAVITSSPRNLLWTQNALIFLVVAINVNNLWLFFTLIMLAEERTLVRTIMRPTIQSNARAKCWWW